MFTWYLCGRRLCGWNINRCLLWTVNRLIVALRLTAHETHHFTWLLNYGTWNRLGMFLNFLCLRSLLLSSFVYSHHIVNAGSDFMQRQRRKLLLLLWLIIVMRSFVGALRHHSWMLGISKSSWWSMLRFLRWNNWFTSDW